MSTVPSSGLGWMSGWDLFGVEVSHLLDFTHGTHQVFTAEKLSRTGTELTADYVFIQTVVTVDADFIDSSLTAFEDTHFQVDGVAHDVYFHRFEAVVQITVIVERLPMASSSVIVRSSSNFWL